MMAAREWVIPVLLGLVAASLTYAFVPEDLHLPRGDGTASGRPDGPYVLMPSPGAAAHDTTLLRFTDAPAHELGGVLTIDRGTVEAGGLSIEMDEALCGHGTRWCRHATSSTTTTTTTTTTNATTAATTSFTASTRPSDDGSAGPAGWLPLGDGPALADDAIGPAAQTADMTFLAFTGSGHLLATNAPRGLWSTYDLHSEFSTFSETTWYFGEGGPPEGASRVPVYRDQVRSALEGTPAGGVQSIVLADHKYDWLVGPVWITARVDRVH